MANIPLTADQISKRWGTIAAWVGFFIVCVLIAPFVSLMITGLAGFAVMFGTWIAYGCFAGFISDTVANWRLKMLKLAAEANPVETLENEELRRIEILKEKKDQISRFDGKTRTFDGKLEWYKSTYPDQAGKYQDVSEKMHQVLASMNKQYRNMKVALDKYHNVVVKGKADWTMALAVKDATADMATVQENFMAQLKTDTALDTIDNAWNTANAEMDSLLLDNDDIGTDNAQKALPEGSHPIGIDLMKRAKVAEPAE